MDPDKENSLAVFPAQCNFSGFKYPLSWIRRIQQGHLQGLNAMNQFFIHVVSRAQMESIKNECQRENCEKRVRNWFVLLDAAAYVSTSALNLDVVKPDFVAVSFYKIFGFPTGI